MSSFLSFLVRPMNSKCRGLFSHLITLRHNTFGRNPPENGSARRRPLFLTTHTFRKRQTAMTPAEFEHTTPASEERRTHALDRAVTGTDLKCLANAKIRIFFVVYVYKILSSSCRCYYSEYRRLLEMNAHTLQVTVRDNTHDH